MTGLGCQQPLDGSGDSSRSEINLGNTDIRGHHDEVKSRGQMHADILLHVLQVHFKYQIVPILLKKSIPLLSCPLSHLEKLGYY